MGRNQGRKKGGEGREGDRSDRGLHYIEEQKCSQTYTQMLLEMWCGSHTWTCVWTHLDSLSCRDMPVALIIC